MPDGYIAVLESSDPAAKEVDNETVDVGGQTRYRQRVVVPGAATDAVLQAVRDRLPAALGANGGVKIEGVAAGQPVPASLPTGPNASTVTRKTLAGTAQEAAAANPNRRYLTIHAEDGDVYVKWGAAASATDYTVKLTAGQTYELPQGASGPYTGVVTIFGASGDVQVTEA